MQLRKQKSTTRRQYLQFSGLEKFGTGVLYLQVLINDEVVTEKLVLAK